MVIIELLSVLNVRSPRNALSLGSLRLRLAEDLSFWLKFAKSNPSISFAYIVGHLEVNPSTIFSDASSSFGMGGCITFKKPVAGFHGKFWQISWIDFSRIVSLRRLRPRHVGINVAEFIAALITQETFLADCENFLSIHFVDNTSALAWLNKDRCSVSPFDKLAQAMALKKLACCAKIWHRYIPTKENTVADEASRKQYGQLMIVNGARFKKSRPRWNETLRFIKVRK